MEDGTAIELLNSLRTTAFASNGRREFLDGLDLIESMLREQERQRIAYHSQLADRDQKITERDKKIEELHARTRIAEEKLSLLQEQIRLDNARRFGHSSERWTPDETIQARLFNELEVAVACDAVELCEEASVPAVARRQRKNRTERVGGGRKPLPANLERREIVLDLPDSEKICRSCGNDARSYRRRRERTAVHRTRELLRREDHSSNVWLRLWLWRYSQFSPARANHTKEYREPLASVSDPCVEVLRCFTVLPTGEHPRAGRNRDKQGDDGALGTRSARAPLTLDRPDPEEDPDERGHEHGRDSRPRPS